jgi:hypothetical protein
VKPDEKSVFFRHIFAHKETKRDGLFVGGCKLGSLREQLER